MICESNGKRHASLADHEANRPMTPRELVEDVIRRKTPSTTLRNIQETDHHIIAILNGRRLMWSKALLVEDCTAAETGLRAVLSKANGR